MRLHFNTAGCEHVAGCNPMSERERIELELRETHREISESGRVLEFHWQLFRRMTLPPDMPAAELSERRLTFLAGAETTFALICAAWNENRTDRVVDKLCDECHRIQAELSLRFGEAEGCA